MTRRTLLLSLPLLGLLAIAGAAAASYSFDAVLFGSTSDPYEAGFRVREAPDAAVSSEMRRSMDADEDGAVAPAEAEAFAARYQDVSADTAPILRIQGNPPTRMTGRGWEMSGAVGPVDDGRTLSISWRYDAVYPPLEGSPVEVAYQLPARDALCTNLTLPAGATVESTFGLAGATVDTVDGPTFRGCATADTQVVTFVPELARWNAMFTANFLSADLVRGSIVQGFTGQAAADRRAIYDADDDGAVTMPEVLALRAAPLPPASFPLTIQGRLPTSVSLHHWSHTGAMLGQVDAPDYFTETIIVNGTFAPYTVPAELNLSYRGPWRIIPPAGHAVTPRAGLSNVTLAADGAESMTAERRGNAPGLAALAALPAPASDRAGGSGDGGAPASSGKGGGSGAEAGLATDTPGVAPDEDHIVDEPEPPLDDGPWTAGTKSVQTPPKEKPASAGAGDASAAATTEKEGPSASTPGAGLPLVLMGLVALALARRRA